MSIKDQGMQKGTEAPNPGLGLAIFDTTRDSNTNTTRKNRVWVCHYRVRVDPIIIMFGGSTR
jgi:hypothetical protein